MQATLSWDTLDASERSAHAEWSRDQRQYLRHHTAQPYKPWLSAELRRIGDEIDSLLLLVCDLVDKRIEIDKQRDAKAVRREAGEAYRRERMEIARRMGERKNIS